MWSVTEARRRLTEAVERASRGERVVLTRRGRPVAAIVPVPREADADGPLGLAAFAGVLSDRDELHDGVAAVIDVRAASRDRDVPEIA